MGLGLALLGRVVDVDLEVDPLVRVAEEPNVVVLGQRQLVQLPQPLQEPVQLHRVHQLVRLNGVLVHDDVSSEDLQRVAEALNDMN